MNACGIHGRQTEHSHPGMALWEVLGGQLCQRSGLFLHKAGISREAELVPQPAHLGLPAHPAARLS